MESEYKRDVSSIVGLSLASGALILAGGLIPLVWMQGFGPFMQGMPGMMQGMMGITFMNMSWIGLLSGVVIIFSAIMMNNYKNTQLWGILILAFSVISLFSFGGFLIGAILGIIAGGLAIARR